MPEGSSRGPPEPSQHCVGLEQSREGSRPDLDLSVTCQSVSWPTLCHTGTALPVTSGSPELPGPSRASKGAGPERGWRRDCSRLQHKQSCYLMEEGWSHHYSRTLAHLLMAVVSGPQPGSLGHSFSGSVPNLLQPLALWPSFFWGRNLGKC